MSFILSEQRRVEDCAHAFERYRTYLAESRSTFPPGAFSLATCEWYFDPTDHRCPHDSWLESITVLEPSAGERVEDRHTTIRILLLGAYHDGYIELFYPRVFRFSITNSATERGHGEWRYDEFRLSPAGGVVHEIEWEGGTGVAGANWIIESSDVSLRWIPKANA